MPSLSLLRSSLPAALFFACGAVCLRRRSSLRGWLLRSLRSLCLKGWGDGVLMKVGWMWGMGPDDGADDGVLDT